MGAANRRCSTALHSWRIVSGKESQLLAINPNAAVSRIFAPRGLKGQSNSTSTTGRTRNLDQLPIISPSMPVTEFLLLLRKHCVRGEKARAMDNPFPFFD